MTTCKPHTKPVYVNVQTQARPETCKHDMHVSLQPRAGACAGGGTNAAVVAGLSRFPQRKKKSDGRVADEDRKVFDTLWTKWAVTCTSKLSHQAGWVAVGRGMEL